MEAAESVNCAEDMKEDTQSDHCYFQRKSDSSSGMRRNSPLSLATYIVENDKDSNTMKIIPVQVLATLGNTDVKFSKDGSKKDEVTQKTASMCGKQNSDKLPVEKKASAISYMEKQKKDSVLETCVKPESIGTVKGCSAQDNSGRDNKEKIHPSTNLELITSREKVRNEDNSKSISEENELSDIQIHSTTCIDQQDFDEIPVSCKIKTQCFLSSEKSGIQSLKRKYAEHDEESDTSKNVASSPNKSVKMTMEIDERNVSNAMETTLRNRRIKNEYNSGNQSGDVTGMVLECEEEEFEHSATHNMKHSIVNQVDEMMEPVTDTSGNEIVGKDTQHKLCNLSSTENTVEDVAFETMTVKTEKLNQGYICDEIPDHPKWPTCDDERVAEMADHPLESEKGKCLLSVDIKTEPKEETIDTNDTGKEIALDVFPKDNHGDKLKDEQSHSCKMKKGGGKKSKTKLKHKRQSVVWDEFECANPESIMKRAVKQLNLASEDEGASLASKYRSSSTIKPIVYTTVLKMDSTGPTKTKKVQYVDIGDSFESGVNDVHDDESADDAEGNAEDSRNLTKQVDYEFDETGKKMEMYIRDVADKAEARITTKLQQNTKNSSQKLMLLKSASNNMQRWRYFKVQEEEKRREMPVRKSKPLTFRKTTTEKSRPVLMEYFNKKLQLEKNLQGQKSVTVGSSTKFIVPLDKTQQQPVGPVPVVKILKVKQTAKTYNSTTKTLVPMQELALEDVSKVKVFPVDCSTKKTGSNMKKMKVVSVVSADGKLVVKDVQKSPILSDQPMKGISPLPCKATKASSCTKNITQSDAKQFDSVEPSKLKKDIHDISKLKTLKSSASNVEVGTGNTNEVANDSVDTSRLKPGMYNINQLKFLSCSASKVQVSSDDVAKVSVDVSKMKSGISDKSRCKTVTTNVGMGDGDATPTGNVKIDGDLGSNKPKLRKIRHPTKLEKDNSINSEIRDDNIKFNSLAEAMRYYTSNGKEIKVVSITKNNPIVSLFPQSKGLPGSILSKLTHSSSEQYNIIPISTQIRTTISPQNPGTTTTSRHIVTTIPTQQTGTTLLPQPTGTPYICQRPDTTFSSQQSGTSCPSEQSSTTLSSQKNNITSLLVCKKELSDSSIKDSDQINTVSKPDEEGTACTIPYSYTDPELKINVFSCSSCLFETQHMNLFARHKSQGCGTSDSEFTRNKTCHSCGHEFTNLRDRMAHLELHSKNAGLEINYHCFICWKGYRTKEELGLHFEYKHNCKFTCSVCGKECTTETEYEQHLQRQHPNHDFYKCDQCESRFNCIRGLKVHKRLSHGLRPNFISKCDICGKEFNKAFKLKEHYKTHTGEKPYECSLCRKRFRCNAFLTRHKRVHTGERPYQCPKCPKAFACHAALFRHDNVHTGKRPYICHICGKGFKAGSALTNHDLIHSGLKRFKCCHCGKPFAFKKTKELHELTHMKCSKKKKKGLKNRKRQRRVLNSTSPEEDFGQQESSNLVYEDSICSSETQSHHDMSDTEEFNKPQESLTPLYRHYSSRSMKNTEEFNEPKKSMKPPVYKNHSNSTVTLLHYEDTVEIKPSQGSEHSTEKEERSSVTTERTKSKSVLLNKLKASVDKLQKKKIIPSE